jgi:hypothetical protein
MDIKIIDEIVSKIQDALKGYDIKVDVNLSKNSEFGFKIDVSGVEIGKLQELNARNKRMSLSYGFTQNIVGMEFENSRNGKLTIHRIVGFKTANRKYPVITTELSTGASYKFPIDQVRKKLGGDSQINRKSNLDKLLE